MSGYQHSQWSARLRHLCQYCGVRAGTDPRQSALGVGGSEGQGQARGPSTCGSRCSEDRVTAASGAFLGRDHRGDWDQQGNRTEGHR
jgi:hypothetical protein